MKKAEIYRWEHAKNFPRTRMAVYDGNLRKADAFFFRRGCEIARNNYDLIFKTKFTTEKLLKFDVIPNTFSSPLVNQRALDILNELCPDDFQAFPAEIETADGWVKGYWILNLTHALEVIDLEKSVYDAVTYDPLDLEGLQKLVLNPAGLAGHHLARAAGFLPQLVASAALAQAFKKAKIKGVDFLTDAQATDYIPPEEILDEHFHSDPEAGRRYLQSALNSKDNFARLQRSLKRADKSRLRELLPTFKDVVELVRSRSSLQDKECTELLLLLKELTQS